MSKKWAAMVFMFNAEDEVINEVAKNVPTKDVKGAGTTIASFPTSEKPLSWYSWFRTVRAIKKQQKLGIAKGYFA